MGNKFYFIKVFLSSLFLLTILIFMYGCQNQVDMEQEKFPSLTGPYLGQQPPGEDPVLFAPGIITSGLYTRDVSMTPDGKEIYFCVTAFNFNLIFYSKEENGRWNEPRPAPFISDLQYMHYEPHVTPDGKRLLFLSNMPVEKDKPASEDIWAVDRIEDEWGQPYNLGAPINSQHQEYYPSVTRTGTLYFTRQVQGEPASYIYRSQFIEGKYSEPEKLGPEVNCGKNHFNAFIDPNERYIIVPVLGREYGYGLTDYYIVFRNENDHWSQPINLGDKINTKSGREYSAYVSPDGKYFFFMSTRLNPEVEAMGKDLSLWQLQKFFSRPGNGNAGIYWMKADFIERLRPEGF
jgi:hypothetical protein